MTGPGTQEAREYWEPTPEEREHIIKYHIDIKISTKDRKTATVSIIGECKDPKCPVKVPSCMYCHRPPC
jgi:hypothetical protein